MLRDGLRDLQDNRCFYCDRPLVALTEVDHFIPRVRSANDSVENFVLTDRGCNGDKSDLLAAPGFVANWTDRNREQAGVLLSLPRWLPWRVTQQALWRWRGRSTHTSHPGVLRCGTGANRSALGIRGRPLQHWRKGKLPRLMATVGSRLSRSGLRLCG